MKLSASALIIGALIFGFNHRKKETYQIPKTTENRSASASTSSSSKTTDKSKDYSSDLQKATKIGFEDVEIDKQYEVLDSQYSNSLQGYVKVEKNQYCYQFPNNYSKTENIVTKGQYLAYYGSENSFAKIKIDDVFYYVNSYGLSKLTSDEKITIAKGIVYVNADNPLFENFAPGLDATAKRAFDTMLQDMQRQGLNIKIASDYRSYSTESKMQEAGDPDSDLAGTSEHQTGTAFDFFTENDQYSKNFAKTDEYKWLVANSYKYGFIERYPADKTDKTSHKACPWHFRFVGVENAKEIYENDLTLEEYLNIN